MDRFNKLSAPFDVAQMKPKKIQIGFTVPAERTTTFAQKVKLCSMSPITLTVPQLTE